MLASWIDIPSHSDFPLENLPYGIFETDSLPARSGVAVGTKVLDLYEVARLGFLDGIVPDAGVFARPVLNEFIALGRPVWQAVRKRLQALLSAEDQSLQPFAAQVLHEQAAVRMRLPLHIGDYTDFYSSQEHATNVGRMFRPDNPLMPNWKHLPVAYHGRASSIVVSGTALHRPHGQTRPDEQQPPVFGPSRSMDFELEMAFAIGRPNPLGAPIPANQAEEYIFGFLLFNDWSARDLQKWEYVPLGPFLGKNFGSSVSPWVVTLEALEPFRVQGPAQDVPVLPYLQTEGPRTFDIQLEVAIQPRSGPETVVCRSNFRHLYWNICQQLAHHTINGCNMNIGDLLASGTISGPTPDSWGSMLELTHGGKQPLILADGSTRRFLEDFDTVIMRAYAQKDGLRIGFGQVSTQLLPALPLG